MAMIKVGGGDQEIGCQALAIFSIACSKTLQPASRSSGLASSASLWETPSLQGTKVMLALTQSGRGQH